MKYKEAGKKGMSSALYSTLPETLETQHAKEASELQSQVPQFTHQPSLRGIKALLFPHGANFEELLLLSSNYYLVVDIKFSHVLSVRLKTFYATWMDSYAEKDMDVLIKVIKDIVNNALLHLF